MLGNDFDPKAKSICVIYLIVAGKSGKGWGKALFFFRFFFSGQKKLEKANNSINYFTEGRLITHIVQG